MALLVLNDFDQKFLFGQRKDRFGSQGEKQFDLHLLYYTEMLGSDLSLIQSSPIKII